MHNFTLLFLLALGIGILIEYWLIFRQAHYVKAHADQVPKDFEGKISLEEHQNAAHYTLKKLALEQLQLLVAPVILLFWTLGSGINDVVAFWQSFSLSPISAGIALLLSVMILSSIVELPFSLWNTFKIEADFGFNKTTPRRFIGDLFLQLSLSLIIGIPLIAAILWTMQALGTYWWFYAWLLWMSFTLVMTWAYPVVIAPLFNKFTPLDNDGLRQRLESLLDRSGFASNGMFVMDGSRRSAHGNAYFTGFGKNKRIVFFDTLLKGLNENEVEAVLAHELGHFKHKHVLKGMVLMATLSLGGLALLGWLANQSWFYSSLGVSEASLGAALLLFMLVLPVFTQFLTPVSSALSRKHEFEADAYAASQTNAKDLISGLVAMYRDNASTLTPDPLYSAFHHSHPPAMVRIKHLEALGDA